jgi:D-glycero-beta-D-manno-heptose-7-phosphate kinase
VRMDYDGGPPTGARLLEEIAGRVAEAAGASEAVVISDYNYGVASATVVGRIREKTRGGGGVPVLVDSRFRLKEFAGFTSATPNEDEVEHAEGRRFEGAEDLAEAGERLREALGFRSLLVTRGKHGMLLLEEGAAPLSLEAVGSHDAVDVTGAGDTVIATYALALASGASFADAARLANHAGGIVVLKRGTASLRTHELLASIEQESDARAL